MPVKGRSRGPDRLHRGAAFDQARPDAATSTQFHRPEQSGAGTIFRRRTKANWRSYLSRGGPGLDAQCRDRLRGTIVVLVRAARGKFYVQLASEPDRKHVLNLIREHAKPDQRVFIGVVDVLDPAVETPEEIRDRVLEAAEYIPIAQLGTADDCGFAPFSDDISRSRETAFAKIRARVLGTQLAAQTLGVG